MRLARVTGGCNAWLRASLAALGGLAQLYGFRAERHGGLHEQGTVLQIALGDEGEPVPPMLLLSRNKSYRPHRFLQIAVCSQETRD
jgi:hypothetical protein